MTSQGNGFGRRPSVRDELLRRAGAGPAEPPRAGPEANAGLSELLTSRGAKQIGGIALGVAIVFAAVAVYVQGMKSAGRALDRQWAENAGYPTLDQVPPTRANSPSTYNELRTACQERAKRADLPRAMDRDLDMFVNIRVGESQLLRHAAFIDCLITEHFARLCQGEHRQHLAGAVRDYFRLRLRVREEWMMVRTPFGQAMGLKQLPGRDGISTRFPSERTDPRIVDGLKSLIADGYMTRADLGGGFFSRMPGDLEEQLKGVERQKRSCG
jgi:hypothetical protein